MKKLYIALIALCVATASSFDAQACSGNKCGRSGGRRAAIAAAWAKRAKAKWAKKHAGKCPKHGGHRHGAKKGGHHGRHGHHAKKNVHKKHGGRRPARRHSV